jgi:diguanylate cyclase (GGDEF)-like protein/PAS domain S-box-containing protein
MNFRNVFDAVNDGIFIASPITRQFIEVNQRGCAMFGYTRAELIGRDIWTLSSGVHPYTRDMALERMNKARAGEPQTLNWQCKTKNDVSFWADISFSYTEIGGTPAFVAIVRDTSEHKRLTAEIVYMAQHDVVTGLSNRAMFAKALDRAITQSLRTGKKFAILALDLDHFKDVNDIHGHLAGDRVLQLVAGRLQASVRVNENVARFGGDEFAILSDDLDEPTEIAALASRLITSIGKPFQIDSNEIFIGASIGVSIFGEDAFDTASLVSHADLALYRAKVEGRKTYRFFSEAMNQQARARVTLTDELRGAIPAGELFLVYQPQVVAKSGRIIGVEALVRWRHPRRGILTPDRFLPVAESSGLINLVGEWVLREACRQARQWIDAGISPGTIAVNLSTAQFKAPLELESDVFAILDETGLPPHLLELEITETTLINLSPQLEEVIQRLRLAGVRFSLDDFGTGYSSLNYLRRFSLDRIKIAREFISDLSTSVEAASIVKLILGLSRELGHGVIAEGVETQQQLNLLQDWKCPEAQGFYFAPPMSAEAIQALLSIGTIEPPTPFAAALAA